jgi:hypothetical protein
MPFREPSKMTETFFIHKMIYAFGMALDPPSFPIIERYRITIIHAHTEINNIGSNNCRLSFPINQNSLIFQVVISKKLLAKVSRWVTSKFRRQRQILMIEVGKNSL